MLSFQAMTPSIKGASHKQTKQNSVKALRVQNVAPKFKSILMPDGDDMQTGLDPSRGAIDCDKMSSR